MAKNVNDSFKIQDTYQPESNERQAALHFAIKEVELGTPDAIALAIAMLKKYQIDIPSLNSLLTLHENITGGRDAKFSQDAKELQEKVLKDIKKILF